MDQRFRKWDRVKAVREGDQCLYTQRYGTVREHIGGDWYDVLLDDCFCTWYRGSQLEKAEPQKGE